MRKGLDVRESLAVGKWQSAGWSLTGKSGGNKVGTKLHLLGQTQGDRTNSRRSRALVMGFQRRDTETYSDDL